MNFFKYFFILLSLLLLFSCSSVFNIQGKKESISLENDTNQTKILYSLIRDYDEELQNKDDKQISENIAFYINEFFKSFDIESNIITEENKIQLHIEDINTLEFVNKIASNDNYKQDNKIIFIDENNNLSFNINKDNYLLILDILPFLKNEIFISYTAAYNQETTEDEFIELIGYVAGKDVASSLKTSVIEIHTNKEIVQFTLLDFMLLHNPIKFTIE